VDGDTLTHLGSGVRQNVGIEPVAHHRLHAVLRHGHSDGVSIERIGHGLDAGFDHRLEGEGERLGQQAG